MFTLGHLAQQVGGRVLGDPETIIEGIQPFEMARGGDLTLAGSPHFLEKLRGSPASAAIVPQGFSADVMPLLQAKNPKLVFAQLLTLFHPVRFEATGISPQATVGDGCTIHDEVSVGPGVSIGDEVWIDSRVTIQAGVCVGDQCRIGSGSILHSNVTLYPRVSLGERVIIHSGTVLGADGFGYVFDGERQVKVPQTGEVLVGDDVEIGANSCVDRATFGATVLERGVKLDNLVHVGHNCRIGENTVVVGCVGISGSVEIGRNCILAGQCGVIDHIRIGDNVTVMVKTAVTRDVADGSVVSGNYCRPHREQLKLEAMVRRLPEMNAQLRQLKEELRLLRERKSTD